MKEDSCRGEPWEREDWSGCPRDTRESHSAGSGQQATEAALSLLHELCSCGKRFLYVHVRDACCV